MAAILKKPLVEPPGRRFLFVRANGVERRVPILNQAFLAPVASSFLLPSYFHPIVCLRDPRTFIVESMVERTMSREKTPCTSCHHCLYLHTLSIGDSFLVSFYRSSFIGF